MTTAIYDKFDKAFQQVSAYALVRNGQQIGKLAFKHPKDGAGRLHCYLHMHGSEMVTGSAGGYGYDRIGASFEAACTKLPASCGLDGCTDIGGQDFKTALRKIGIECYQAV